MLKFLSNLSGVLDSVLRLFGIVLAYFKGRSDVLGKQDKKRLRDIRDAKAIRDRLVNDDEYAQWVRDQFKR